MRLKTQALLGVMLVALAVASVSCNGLLPGKQANAAEGTVATPTPQPKPIERIMGLEGGIVNIETTVGTLSAEVATLKVQIKALEKELQALRDKGALQ